MAIEGTVPRTRRALLAGGIGGIVALAAAAIGRPLPARAGMDGDVVLGDNNLAAKATTISCLETAFQGISGSDEGLFGQSYGRSGVFGYGGQATPPPVGLPKTGVYGYTDLDASSVGVFGRTKAGRGVVGTSSSGIGVFAMSDATDRPAMTARTRGNQTALLGYSGGFPDVLPETPTRTGVYGYARQDTSSAGVRGESPAGRGVLGVSETSVGVAGRSTSGYGVSGTSAGSVGVNGQSTSGVGILGFSTGHSAIYGVSNSPDQPAVVARSQTHWTGLFGYSGDGTGSPPAAPAKTGVYGRATQDSNARGVHGHSTGGRGVYGQATSGTGVYGYATTGYALRTSGRVRFDKVSGVATIAAGAIASTKITPGADITTSSYVLLTPQGDPGTRRFWAQLDVTNNTLTIRTNATSTKSFRVAWLLVG